MRHLSHQCIIVNQFENCMSKNYKSRIQTPDQGPAVCQSSPTARTTAPWQLMHAVFFPKIYQKQSELSTFPLHVQQISNTPPTFPRCKDNTFKLCMLNWEIASDIFYGRRLCTQAAMVQWFWQLGNSDTLQLQVPGRGFESCFCNSYSYNSSTGSQSYMDDSDVSQLWLVFFASHHRNITQA